MQARFAPFIRVVSMEHPHAFAGSALHAHAATPCVTATIAVTG
jgi:hypothetical protein